MGATFLALALIQRQESAITPEWGMTDYHFENSAGRFRRMKKHRESWAALESEKLCIYAKKARFEEDYAFITGSQKRLSV
jgi:hypothetical protein